MAKKNEKNIKDKTSFGKKFKAELKKVIWPTPKQLFNNTVAVLSIVIITAIIVFVLDFAFESINKYGVNKIKESIANSASNSTTNTVTDENETSNSESTEDSNSSEENAVQEETTNSSENAEQE